MLIQFEIKELTIIGNNCEDNDDLLDKQRCLDSLASLRHSKWFQVRLYKILPEIYSFLEEEKKEAKFPFPSNFFHQQHKNNKCFFHSFNLI